jgi:hypothetical protein
MKNQNLPQKSEFAFKDKAPVRKQIGLELAINDEHLGAKVRKAFDLARIAGHELNITFNHAACE